MKTSYILLAIIALVALTGMVANDVLLKHQYDKIDWINPYQHYEQRALPAAKHWVIEGTPTSEIILKNATQAQALIDPDQLKFYRVRQLGDTVFVSFTPDYSGYRSEPRDDADRQLGVQLIVQLPHVKTVRVKNGRLTLSEFATDSMAMSLQKSRLRTNKITISTSFALTASQNSFAVLGDDHYHSLHTIVQDSSGVQLNNCLIDTFSKQVSPRAEVQLRGQALKWLK